MSNKVHVRFFAIFREYVGVKEDWAEIEPGTTVEELWLKYVEHAKNPRVTHIRAAYSVNQKLAKPETKLQGGEEVGFLPPVSGGAEKIPASARKKASKPVAKVRRTGARLRAAVGKKSSRMPSPARNFWVTSHKLSLDALIKRVERPGAGAIVTFIGTVRDHARDKAVKYLEYEAYDELAVKTLEQIGGEVQARWPEVRLAMAHRTGHLDIGEASVMIAASAPHRAEAFAASRYAIERIKAIIPVWKKEFASGHDYWVEGPVAGEMSLEQAEQVVREAEPAAKA